MLRTFLGKVPRGVWIVVGLLSLLGLYAFAGYRGVPWLAERLLREQVTALGHQVQVGTIAFDPFRFQATIQDLRLTDAAGAPVIGFARLDVDAEVLDSVLERGVVLHQLKLDAPDVAVVVAADGSVNLARLVPPPKPDEPKQDPSSVPRVRIGALEVNRGRVQVEDRSRPEPFALELSPVAFALTDFRTDGAHANRYNFSGTANTGERLEWAGEFTVQPLGSHGHFALRNIQTSTAVAYLQDQLPVRLLSGVAEAEGDYRLQFDPALSLDLTLPVVRVRDLALGEVGIKDATPAVAAGEILLSDVAVSLARRQVSAKALDLGGVRVNLRREADGRINLSRLVAASAPSDARPAAPATAPSKAEPAEPVASAPAAPPAWRVSLAALRLDEGTVRVQDLGVKPALDLNIDAIQVKLGPLASDALDQPVAVEAGLRIDGRGRARAKGTLVAAPLSTQLALSVQDLDLRPVQPYLAPYTQVELRSAVLGARGDLKYAQQPARLDFKGQADLDRLSLREIGTRRDLLSWRSLAVRGIDYRQTPARLEIDRVALGAPSARVVISPERTINLAQAFAPPGPAQAAPPAATETKGKAAPASASLPVRVRSVVIEEGQLDFADRSIEPTFAAAIQKLRGRVDGLSTAPGAGASLLLEGQVDAFSPVRIEGRLVPSAFDRDTSVALSFRNMDLVRFNPYSGRFAGYNIVKGKLSTELKYRIQARALQAEHHVVVDQLEFGEATGSKDAVPLPIKLAVSLLKDRHGTIDLQLPVSGDLDDPSFRVAPLVWKVLVNLLTKAVTAPFAALGSLFGGGEELSYVAFAPGRAALTAEESAKLEKLARALVERPQLKLDLPYAFDETRDRELLSQQLLERRVEAFRKPDKSGDKAERQAYEALFRELEGRAPEYPDAVRAAPAEQEQTARIDWLRTQLLLRLRVPDEALERLAADRARAVQAVLLANPEIAPERVFLTARRAASVDAESGTIRMELKLQ